MTHPGGVNLKSVALAVLLGGVASAHAQEADDGEQLDPSARERAEVVASYLVAGLPCTATETAGALERRLTESIDPLVDLAAGLDIVSASPENCAEIRAAAARQRLYITQSAISGGDTDSLTAGGTVPMLAFEVGPPPLNLLRGRGGSH